MAKATYQGGYAKVVGDSRVTMRKNRNEYTVTINDVACSVGLHGGDAFMQCNELAFTLQANGVKGEDLEACVETFISVWHSTGKYSSEMGKRAIQLVIHYPHMEKESVLSRKLKQQGGLHG